MKERSRKGKSNKPDAKVADAGSPVEKFARAFKTESELRDHLATLLRKMGSQEVRITHGTGERGKDIVFYGPNGIGGRSLYACVVKNDRIIGDVTSSVCAQVVYRQAEQALREPYRNPSTGNVEKVAAAYVMSPHEATEGAIDSIGRTLSSIGNVEFVCGAKLLDLFAAHWRSFLLFESNVLVSYLSTLRSTLQHDRALIELVLRQSILANAPAEFEAMYVQQDFGEQVLHAEVAPRLLRPLQIASAQAKLGQLSVFERTIAEVTAVANYLVGANRLPPGEHAPAAIGDRLVKAIWEDWKSAYELHVGRLMKDQANLPKELRGMGPPQLPSERQVALDIKLRPKTLEWLDRAESLRSKVAALLTADCDASNSLAGETGDAKSLIGTEKFLAFCRLQNLQEDAPGTVTFEASRPVRSISVDSGFLGSGIPISLLVGPAGFGKTSFCKSQALTSAANLLSEEDDILPVYVPLSKFASHVPTTAGEAFFESSELRQLVAEASRNTRIRLFLDGMDEIPNPQRQNEIVNLARSVSLQVPDCQVVITARDHVRGAWLDGIPRLRVNQLNEAQQRRLVGNWLGSTEATDKFFEQLPPSLRAVMGVPLLATLTAAVYRKHQHLPENRTSLYALFVDLMCGGWDAVKGTNRGSQFGKHDKQTVLKSLAGMNHLAGRRDAPKDAFQAAVRASLSGLIDHADDLLRELLQDGLIVDTGSAIRFSHLSFQEFMAAEYLHAPEGERAKVALGKFFGGDDWWAEVLVYYATATSNPAEMEDWLIKRAQAYTSKAAAEYVLAGKVDERLNLLRKAVRDAFPSYRSQYPDDGIFIEKKQRTVSGEIVVEEIRRTLSGARLDPNR